MVVVKPSQEPFVSEVFDRGRRGKPLLGCDCVTCFGYCLLDSDAARREEFESWRAVPRLDPED